MPRPRLSERLDRAAAARLMLVSAPAGFGKTTLLAEWLAKGPAAAADARSAAWLSLDRGGNDPLTFWTYVIAALRTVAPEVGTSEALLASPCRRPSTGCSRRCNDLGATGGDIVLVLDDCHVIDTREAHDAMAFLLDHMPLRLHLVIASRADPAVPLARCRLLGAVAAASSSGEEKILPRPPGGPRTASAPGPQPGPRRVWRHVHVLSPDFPAVVAKRGTA